MKPLTLKITTPTNVITQRIKSTLNRGLFKQEFPRMNEKYYNAAIKINKLLIQAFMNSEIYISLLDGELRAEFGLDDIEVNRLPDLLQKIISCEVFVSSEKKNNMVTIIVLPFNENDIDFNIDGVYISEKSGESIHWLWWLLTQGENTVVRNSYIRFIEGAGRSHMAIMIKKENESYSVDGYFAGVPGDNWITRTLRENTEEVKSIIKDVIGAP